MFSGITFPELIILVGIPGSGKTTYGEEYVRTHNNSIKISSDEIRKELFGDESIQQDPEKVFCIMNQRTVDALNNGKTVVYDSTAINRKNRQTIISMCPKFVSIKCVIVWSPIETCIKRDSERNRTVGKEVIDRMLKKFEPPFYDEGIDNIIVFNSDEKMDIKNYLLKTKESMNISHDNPHHSKNILDHCTATMDYIAKKDASIELTFATLFHDCGKPYVKSFVNSKGEITDVAHYYGHPGVSAWISYGLLSNTSSFYSVWLIGNHMLPYFNSSYYKSLPEFLKKDIDLIHEADEAAH